MRKFTLTAEELGDIARHTTDSFEKPHLRHLTLDAIDQLKYTLDQLTVHPGLFGSYEYSAALAAFQRSHPGGRE